MRIIILALLFLVASFKTNAQRVPSAAENLEFFSVFGNQSDKAYGDDDFSQVIFFVIPKNYKSPFFIRVFDAEVGGKFDEPHDGFNTQIDYSVYGGRDAFSEASKNADPIPGYDSGRKLFGKTIGVDAQLDNNWLSMGPFNPIDGQLSNELGGYIFKLIVNGVSGNDGNLFSIFLSTTNTSNREVDGANAFAYEYSVRLPAANQVAHVFPFVTSDITAVVQHNFDFDNDGEIMVYSVSKNRHSVKASGNNVWGESKHLIDANEINTSLDFQIVKKGSGNNDFVIYLVNQYNEAVSFFSSPIGGIPKYKYQPKINTVK